MIEFSNISKTYHGPDGVVTGLDNVSFTANPGDFIAIEGPSGCGKSTLLLTCGTLLTPDTGDVKLLDQHPYSLSKEQRAKFRSKHIGFVFQRFHLTPYLSVLENVMLPTLAAHTSNAREKALQLVEQFGLSHRTKHNPSELSVGERQRVGMARALLNSPDILLADEPTGNLDPASGDLVLNALEGFSREGGIAIMVSHEPSATQRASRVIKMKNGCLA